MTNSPPPRHWRFDAAPSDAQLTEIADTLRAGGVVLLPTDTIYGLHAVASNETAVERIGAIKGREGAKPFLVLAASIDQLRSLGVTSSGDRLESLGEIWPAPLTVVLPLAEPVPASRGAKTLGVRIPALDWLRRLVETTGPLVSTSANRSGHPAVDEPALLAPDVQQQLDGIADAGRLDGKPSAILDLTGGEARFVREDDRSFTQSVRKILRKSR